MSYHQRVKGIAECAVVILLAGCGGDEVAHVCPSRPDVEALATAGGVLAEVSAELRLDAASACQGIITDLGARSPFTATSSQTMVPTAYVMPPHVPWSPPWPRSRRSH